MVDNDEIKWDGKFVVMTKTGLFLVLGFLVPITIWVGSYLYDGFAEQKLWVATRITSGTWVIFHDRPGAFIIYLFLYICIFFCSSLGLAALIRGVVNGRVKLK
jgi:hypothetical protein